MRIFLDLDGVLADFNGTTDAILKDLGCPNDWKTEVERPMWGMVGSHIKDIYSRLNVLPDAKELVDFCMNHCDDVQVLTAIPRRGYFPDAVDHKRAWVAKHFPEIKHVNFGPYAKDKQYHLRQPDDMLIDDSKMNIKQWIARGGQGYLHTSTNDTIYQIQQKEPKKLV